MAGDARPTLAIGFDNFKYLKIGYFPDFLETLGGK